MKTLYFDCFSGISGDMTLAALIDLGVDQDRLVSELRKLHVDGWEISVTDAVKHGIRAKHVDTEPTGHHATAHTHEHRTMAGIAHIIDHSAVSANAKDIALRIFRRLAEAEARVHGTTPDEVHFHEVGAVDSIVDIVGVAICLDILSPCRICASVLHDGYGFVKCQHGTIPVPVPAVAELLSARGIPFRQHDIEGEMMTPTGAAILAELADSFGPMPEMTVERTGYGAGTKDFPIPNILRIVMGETADAAAADAVTVIETNIDDSTPEVLGYTMERLLAEGALDVFFTPVYMKKCRPATMLTVICREADAASMERILFAETSTIGVRKYRAERSILPRRAVTVCTPYGDIKGKETTLGGTTRTTLEYEDAARIAREKQIPLREIFQAIKKPGF